MCIPQCCVDLIYWICCFSQHTHTSHLVYEGVEQETNKNESIIIGDPRIVYKGRFSLDSYLPDHIIITKETTTTTKV